MAYTVLARRYRSGTFDEVIGQNHVAQTLKKAIDSGRIAHAYLFCGTRGVGKTSMARILAKALNCEKSQGPTTQPCGKCNSCQAIARGDDIDVVEIDAASNTQVDKTREVIVDNAMYRPAHGRFKIYIIDEAHMLSKASFNALLKTLEEPPGHVKFILATTEPEKILPTILSRCQRYDFRNIPTREIAAHLTEICKSEKIEADEDAILLVAKSGAGSMRDALSLLDRLLSVGEKKLTADMIEQLLGLPKVQLMYDLAQAIGEGSAGKVLQQADALITGGLSVDALIASLIDHLRNLLIIRTCGLESNLVEVPGLSPKQLNEQAGKFDPTALTQDIVILEELRRQMRSSQAGRALLDATLVRLSLAEQFATVEELLERLGGGGGTEKKKYEPVAEERHGGTEARRHEVSAAVPAVPTIDPPAAVPETAPSQSSSVSVDDVGDDLPAVGRVWEGEKVSLGAAFARSATPAKPKPQSNVEPVSVGNAPQLWQALLQKIQSKSPGLVSVVSAARLGSVDNEQVTIRFAANQDTYAKMLERNGKKDLVRDAVCELLERSVSVKVEIDPPGLEPEAPAAAPAAAAAPARRPMPAPAAAAPQPVAEPTGTPLTNELKAALAQDPYIKAIMEQLGGQIRKVE